MRNLRPHGLTPGPERRTPDDAWLKREYHAGLTYDQMREKWFNETGIQVTRSAISAAISRAGLGGGRRDRYSTLIPWTVRVADLNTPEAIALRVLARLRAGKDVSSKDQRRLETLRRRLASAGNPVISYVEDGPDQGWVWLERVPEDGDSLIREDPMQWESSREA